MRQLEIYKSIRKPIPPKGKVFEDKKKKEDKKKCRKTGKITETG